MTYSRHGSTWNKKSLASSFIHVTSKGKRLQVRDRQNDFTSKFSKPSCMVLCDHYNMLQVCERISNKICKPIQSQNGLEAINE